ncbi:hypothetical protein LIER_43837 [Lithospermum erythrorhizon]|uniref:Pentatricopeptide repeat-containing protein n=1 Tax=Lithospermum erythrorhizon TaxID=34254 RepID=A0AAV3QYG5_LITER
MQHMKCLKDQCIPTKIPFNRFLNKAVRRLQQCSFYSYHQPFDEMSHRDISSLNSILASYIRERDPNATWDFFVRVHKARVDLNSYTFTPVLRACSILQKPIRGKQVHALMIKSASDVETITKTALIDMYSKYGELDESVRIFYEMVYKDVVAWNAMLSNYLRHGMPVKALAVFGEMKKEQVDISEFTLCSVLKACTSVKAYKQGEQIHGMVVVIGRDLVVLGTALVDFYSSLGYIDKAIKIYQTLNWTKDDIMHNSLIFGCVINKRYDFAMLLMSKIRPNVIALTSALVACSQGSDLWIGKQIHGVAIRRDFLFQTQFCNTLLDMYAKCGNISSARLVFDAIHQKDVVSWTSMIDAYGSHGCGIEAVELFKNMGDEESGVLPNYVTFINVLSACGHSGLVEEGRECFVLFQNKYGVEPAPEHYACFIDILGRASHIEEVWSLFHDMLALGTKPTADVWAALLNACKLNHDVERGESAANNLLELDPDKPGNYIAVSNFYAAIGRWDSVDRLRNLMKDRGLAKEEGSSWVNDLPTSTLVKN